MRRRPPRLHPRRRRADRDEQLRREPGRSSRSTSSRTSSRRSTRAAVRLAREAREVAGRDVFIAGSIGPLGDVELAGHDPAELYAEQARLLEGRGVDLFMVETFYDLDELETAIARGPLGLVAADRRAAHLRRRRRDARGRDGGATRPSACARSASPRSARTTAPARPPRSRRSRRWAATAPCSPRCRTSASRACRGQRIVFPHATPEYFGEFAAQARALGARLIGGCCGTTPAQIAAIRAAVDEDRAPAGSLPRPRARAGCAPFAAGDGGDAARAAAARGRVRGLGAGRPAARRQSRGADRDGARRPRLRTGAVRRRQRQPARAGADERDHGLGRDRALHRRRDDPAPDPARHDDRRARVAPARRARGGRPQHPRGHRRPARGGRLPGHARRLRGRLDRARRADREAQPRARTGTAARSTRRRRSSPASR